MRLKLAKIGNSRGILLPAALIRRYSLGPGMHAEPNAEGILLRPVRAHAGKLSWTDAGRAMAEAKEDWSDWNSRAARQRIDIASGTADGQMLPANRRRAP